MKNKLINFFALYFTLSLFSCGTLSYIPDFNGTNITATDTNIVEIIDNLAEETDYYIQVTGKITKLTLENIYNALESCKANVFLDLENQFAVCDGLSKAYVLLCAIEGIDCVKVNGKADGAGHAWNKVYLVDDEYNVNGW